MALLHDNIAHGGTPSGLDASTSTHGGFIAYRKSEGAKKLNVRGNFSLLVVDTHSGLRSSVTANRVRLLIEKNFKKTMGILNSIDSISHKSVDYLKSGNMKKTGELMLQNQEMLRKLGISTNKIDSLISYIKKRYPIYGSKLTGGGGGGSIIVLADDYSKLIKDLNARGYSTYLVNVDNEGVKNEVYSHHNLPQEIKGVIFDADEVLYYRNKVGRNLKIKLLQRYGYNQGYKKFLDSYHREKWQAYINEISRQELFRKILHNIGLNLRQSNLEKFTKEFLNAHKKILAAKSVEALLKKLKKSGIKVCILTDTIFSGKEKWELLKSIGLDKHIDLIISSHDIKKSKKTKESYNECLRKMGLKANDVIFVGHKKYEMEGAKNANIVSVVVLPVADKNIKSDYKINSMKELGRLILNKGY